MLWRGEARSASVGSAGAERALGARCYDRVMCLICIELDRSAMTTREARRALGEMRVAMDPAHVEEVEAKLAEADEAAEQPVTKPAP